VQKANALPETAQHVGGSCLRKRPRTAELEIGWSDVFPARSAGG
jgi:hypothetical protein